MIGGGGGGIGWRLIVVDVVAASVTGEKVSIEGGAGSG